MPHDVFISYATTDFACAEAICSTLEIQAIKCWIAPRNIPPGQEWAAAITDAIRATRVMILVFSSTANDSPHIMREVSLAVDSGVTIIPFRIQQTVYSQALAYYLGTSQWIDALTEPIQKHIAELTTVVAFLVSHASPSVVSRDARRKSDLRARPKTRATPQAPAASASSYFLFKSWEARAVRLGLMTGLLIGRNSRVEFSDRLFEVLADFSKRWHKDFASLKSEGELIGHAAGKVWSEIQKQRSDAVLTLEEAHYLFDSVSQQMLNWLLEQGIEAKIMSTSAKHVALAQDLTDEAIDWIGSHCPGTFTSEVQLRSWTRNVFNDLVHARIVLSGSESHGTDFLLGELAFSMFRKSSAYRGLVPLAVKK